MINDIKKGTFRWRKKFRYLPTRKKLVDTIGIEWLANRIYYVLNLHITKNPEHEFRLVRIKWLEFEYIIQKQQYEWVFEIIQKEPKTIENYGTI